MPRDQLAYRLDQAHLVERLAQIGVGARFAGALLGRQDAENEDRDVARLGVLLERAAHAQPVEPGDQDLGDQDRGLRLPRAFESRAPVRREVDLEARLLEEEPLERANVRIALDDEDQSSRSVGSRCQTPPTSVPVAQRDAAAAGAEPQSTNPVAT